MVACEMSGRSEHPRGNLEDTLRERKIKNQGSEFPEY